MSEREFPREELDFRLCVTSGQVFRFVEYEGSVWRGVDGGDVIEAFHESGGKWRVRSFPDPAAAERFLRAEVRLADVVRRIVELEPSWKPLVDRFPGLRVLRQARADETLFSFLCTVNNHLSRIHRLVQTLGSFGECVGDGLFRFPVAGAIAEIGESRLRQMGFGYRARTITAVAGELVARGEDWLPSLKSVPYEEAVRGLCDLPGVGRKVADCVCLFGLGFDEAVPVDVHLWRATAERFFPDWIGKSLTEHRYRAVGDYYREKFGRLAGFAHQYLFYDSIQRGRRGSETKRPRR
jgi:N-glycosylase/DNA lyase